MGRMDGLRVKASSALWKSGNLLVNHAISQEGVISSLAPNFFSKGRAPKREKLRVVVISDTVDTRADARTIPCRIEGSPSSRPSTCHLVDRLLGAAAGGVRSLEGI